MVKKQQIWRGKRLREMWFYEAESERDRERSDAGVQCIVSVRVHLVAKTLGIHWIKCLIDWMCNKYISLGVDT